MATSGVAKASTGPGWNSLARRRPQPVGPPEPGPVGPARSRTGVVRWPHS